MIGVGKKMNKTDLETFNFVKDIILLETDLNNSIASEVVAFEDKIISLREKLQEKRKQLGLKLKGKKVTFKSTKKEGAPVTIIIDRVREATNFNILFIVYEECSNFAYPVCNILKIEDVK